jgi:gas vesicle protein
MNSQKVGRGEVQKRSNGSAGALFLGTLMGLMAGAAAGVLMAPQSGEATKEEILARGESLRTRAEMRLHEGRSQAEHRLNKARNAMAEWLKQGSQVLDRQAEDLRA